MKDIPILTLRPKWEHHWKLYEDGTEILLFGGVQIASIQPGDEQEFEVYSYDSDFQILFQGLEQYPYVSKSELKNKVQNIFMVWIDEVVKDFNTD